MICGYRQRSRSSMVIDIITVSLESSCCPCTTTCLNNTKGQCVHPKEYATYSLASNLRCCMSTDHILNLLIGYTLSLPRSSRRYHYQTPDSPPSKRLVQGLS